MRVAMYMPGLAPGTASWSIYQDLASAIRRQGIDFEVVTSGIDEAQLEGDSTRSLELPRKLGVVDRLAAPLLRNRSTLAHAAALRRYVEATSPDLLYVEIVYPTGAAASLARRLSSWRGALALMPAGEDFLVVPEADYGFRRHLGPRWAFRWALRDADAVRYISPLVEEDLRHLVRSPTALIPASASDTGLEPASWDDDVVRRYRRDARARVAERHALGGGRLILSLGRLHPFKGIHFLVEAMVEIPDAVLLIAGRSLTTRRFGDYGRYLIERAREFGVDDRVRLIGPVDHADVPEVLAAADAVAVPSIRESQNRVCIEAAAVSTPFVVTRTTGVAAFVPDDGVGRIVEPGDPAALGAALRDCLGSDALPHRAEAVEFARMFAADRVAPELVDLFRAAISRADRRS